MSKKTCIAGPCACKIFVSVRLYARKVIYGAVLGLILIFMLGKLSMAEVWEKIEPSGSPPNGRNGHVLISSGGPEQFVFGGFGQSSDLWILRQEGEIWRWENMVAKGTNIPSQRGGHSGVFVDQGIIIFAGSQSFVGTLVDSETYKLNNPWDPSSVWQKLETTGTVPSARAEHTAVYDEQNKRMLIFGGYTSTSPFAVSNDTYVLDFSINPASWTKLNTTGEIPARYGHSAVRGGMGMMVFGGTDGYQNLLDDCWELDLEENQWIPVNVAGDKPPVRWQHTAVWTWGQQGGEMIIFGGKDENGNPVDDIWVLHTLGPGEPGYRWERIYPIGDSPSGRAGHAAALGWGGEGGEKMFIFGGADEKGDLNDVYAFSGGEKVKETLEEKPFNAPNPFNPYEGETKICYYLDRDDDNVTIKLFTLTGDLVYSWENISGREGLNQWPWNGRNEKGKIVENGGYICLIESAGKKQKCKIAVLK